MAGHGPLTLTDFSSENKQCPLTHKLVNLHSRQPGHLVTVCTIKKRGKVKRQVEDEAKQPALLRLQPITGGVWVFVSVRANPASSVLCNAQLWSPRCIMVSLPACLVTFRTLQQIGLLSSGCFRPNAAHYGLQVICCSYLSCWQHQQGLKYLLLKYRYYTKNQQHSSYKATFMQSNGNL